MESADVELLVNLLRRYLSPVNARALVGRALREGGVVTETATRAELRKCNGTLRRGVELFVAPESRDGALKDIALFCGVDSSVPEPCSLAIESENDVSKARSEARRICTHLGAQSFAMQKVATIVSELSRNIVLYAKKGQIDIVAVTTSSKKVIIRAVDNGPGIPHIEHVLSGHYQSKTGLGRGLFGTRKLADRFDILTGAEGTQVTAEVKVV